MPGIIKRRSMPPILAVTALVSLVVVFVMLNGDGSRGAAERGLAAHAPEDAVAYAETDLRPGGRVASQVDGVVRVLTGSSLRVALDEAFGKSGPSEIDFAGDVEPWLAGPVALTSGGSRSESAVIAEAADLDRAGAFTAELERSSEFPAGARAGVVGDAVVVSRSDAFFERISEASDGDSLADAPEFADSMERLPDDSVAELFLADDALLSAIRARGGAASDAIEALEPLSDGSGTALALSTGPGSVSIQGFGGPGAGGGSDGSSALLESFPADSVIAAGAGGIGPALEAVAEGLGETAAAPGSDDPDEDPAKAAAGAPLAQASALGVDLPALVGSLESAGIFVTPGDRDGLRGAIVARSSDPGLVSDTISSVTSVGSLAGPDLLRPLPGLGGFSVTLPGVVDGRVVVASKGDRLTVALGVEAARHALSPPTRTLADSPAYREATSTLSAGEVGLFAQPSVLAPLVREKARGHDRTSPGHGEAVARLVRLFSAVDTVVAASSEDGSFEIDIDLRD